MVTSNDVNFSAVRRLSSPMRLVVFSTCAKCVVTIAGEIQPTCSRDGSYNRPSQIENDLVLQDRESWTKERSSVSRGDSIFHD